MLPVLQKHRNINDFKVELSRLIWNNFIFYKFFLQKTIRACRKSAGATLDRPDIEKLKSRFFLLILTKHVKSIFEPRLTSLPAEKELVCFSRLMTEHVASDHVTSRHPNRPRDLLFVAPFLGQLSQLNGSAGITCLTPWSKY